METQNNDKEQQTQPNKGTGQTNTIYFVMAPILVLGFGLIILLIAFAIPFIFLIVITYMATHKGELPTLKKQIKPFKKPPIKIPFFDVSKFQS